MAPYKKFAKTFIMLSAITSLISTTSVEIRRLIHKTKQPAFKHTNHFLKDFLRRILYTLRIIPYRLSEHLGILNKDKQVPEIISFLYTFILSFFIALMVYHLFLLIFGYKYLYLYFFGLAASKEYAPRNLKI